VRQFESGIPEYGVGISLQVARVRDTEQLNRYPRTLTENSSSACLQWSDQVSLLVCSCGAPVYCGMTIASQLPVGV